MDRLGTADAIRSSATEKVANRHEALWDPDGPRMTTGDLENPTIYDHGYLHHADTLCYWEREWVEARRAMGITDVTPPNCL